MDRSQPPEGNGNSRALFPFNGKQDTFALGPVSASEAEARPVRVNRLLLRIRQNLVTLPAGVRIEDFLADDGRVKEPERAPPPDPVPFDRFQKAYPDIHRGVLEDSSLKTAERHLRGGTARTWEPATAGGKKASWHP